MSTTSSRKPDDLDTLVSVLALISTRRDDGYRILIDDLRSEIARLTSLERLAWQAENKEIPEPAPHH